MLQSQILVYKFGGDSVWFGLMSGGWGWEVQSFIPVVRRIGSAVPEII
jgi:hypothetical protein